MRPENRKALICAGVVLVAMAGGLPLTAGADTAGADTTDTHTHQSQDTTVTREDDSLPVIIVTPAWRPVDLQQVAGSVNHYGGEELTAGGVFNTLDLQYQTPGFVFKTNSVLGQPYLRGIGSDFVSAGAESSVATFIDGVYLPRAYDTIVDFFDVDRVEVLRGPQAVHLGRNVVGGAISVHTVEPRAEMGGYVDLTAGNFSQRQLRAALNAPLMSNDAGASVILRLAGISTQRDGYVRNINLGTDANDDDFHALRTKLLVVPNDRLDLLVTYERHSEDSSRALGSQPRTDVGTNGGILMGGTVPDNPRHVTENVPPQIRMTSNRYGARFTWEGGRFDLVSNTAWIATDGALALDLDGTDADFSANYPTGRSRSLMQEVRLVSGDEHGLSWTAGVFVLNEDAEQMLDVRLPQTGTRNNPVGAVATRSQAMFAEVGHAFTSTVRGTLGARYSRDHRRHDFTRTVTNPDGQTVTTQNERADFSALTPELGVEFRPDGNRLFYFTAARGYKAGGFNTSTIQPPFESEFIWAYEVGMKTTLADHGMRINTALFHYDYRDMQLNTPPTGAPPGTFPRVINAARSTIRGLDIDLLWQPVDVPWFVSVGSAFMHARFSDFDSFDSNNPDVATNRAGNSLPQAPDVSVNLATGWQWRLPAGTARLRTEYRYQSAIYFNIYQDRALYQGAYGLANVSFSFEPADGRWFAELWSRNVTDRLYAQTISRNDPLTGVKQFWGAPRTWGVRSGVRW